VRQIAIVGSGPMAIYLLKALSTSSEPLAITVFEASETAGIGMPYDPALNADYMLCNAFSREIPKLDRTLIDWLKDRPARELSEWELSAHDLTARAFFPRVLIGEYLQSQFEDLGAKARKAGHLVEVLTSCRVDDILPRGGTGAKAEVSFTAGHEPKKAQFDDVVIASGHSWPERPEIHGISLVSPWPYTRITNLDQPAIGVLGSSLSAIDIVIALGHARGTFDEIGDQVRWLPNDADAAFRITMVSHMGIMPEGDFYYPFPYEHLERLTPEAINEEIARGPDKLLDRVFALLCEELDCSDPDYLSKFAESGRSVEGFGPAYFSRRRDLGGLSAVKKDLASVRETLKRKETIPHRYVLLRGHEIFDRILRHLPQAEYDRFLEHLMPVFADCYAAVPHLSLARIIALYDAGVLELKATEEGAKFTQFSNDQIDVMTEDGVIRFDVVVDARGQDPAALLELPFPQLVRSLRMPEKPLLAPFKLDLIPDSSSRVFCLSMPQLLERHPFSQGLVESSKHASHVADDILKSE
jgi:uncharacterized NAD(P)/FAD-binding protein YdhS